MKRASGTAATAFPFVPGVGLNRMRKTRVHGLHGPELFSLAH